MANFRWYCLLTGPLLWSQLAVAALLWTPAVGAGQQGPASAGTPGQVAAAPATSESQREAAALLKGMADYVSGLNSFSVTFRAGYDVVQSSGQKIEFGETRKIALSRPDRLSVEEVASDGKRDRVVFDGRNVSVLDGDNGVYARVPQPGTIDDTLAYFVRDLRMRMPLALLLTTRLPDVVAGSVKTIDYVEDTEILGVATHHVAGRTDKVDFQFWIREGKSPLPLRVVITYKHSPGEPQFWANFADWNTSPKFSDVTFEFNPPPGAKQIPFAVQVRKSAEADQQPNANGEIEP
jgi:hypothetical protein